MKKTLLKGLTVVTLLVCLVMALAGCANDNNSGSSNNTPKPSNTETLRELKGDLAFIVTDEQKAGAEKFFNDINTSLKNSLTKKGSLFVKSSGKLNVTANPKSDKFVFADNADKKVYVDFGVQAFVDKDDITKNAIFLDLRVGGAPTKNESNDAQVYVYYSGTTKDAIVSAVKPGVVNFEQKIKAGDFIEIASVLEKVGVPNLDNLLGEIEGVLPSNIAGMIPSILGSSIEDFANQQLKTLVTRLLYKGTGTNLTPVFNNNNGQVTINITSEDIEDAIHDFFKRASAIRNDKSYEPKYDYFDADGNAIKTNKKDDLHNDSDAFFKKGGGFETIIELINGQLEKKYKDTATPNDWKQYELSSNPSNWASHFKISDNAAKLDAGFTLTDNGFTNGSLKFVANKDAYVELPYVNKTNKQTNTLKSKIELNITDVNFEVKNKADSDAIDFGSFDKAKFDTKKAVNSANFRFSGKIVGKVNGEVVKYNYTLDSDVDAFAFLTVDEGKDNAKIVAEAFKRFEFFVEDDVENTIYYMKWDATKKAIVVKEFGNANEIVFLTAEDIANAIIRSKNIITINNSKPILQSIDITKIIEMTKPEFVKPHKDNDIIVGSKPVTMFPAGFDKVTLGIFKMDYTKIFGKDIDFAKQIFGDGVTEVGMTVTNFEFGSAIN